MPTRTRVFASAGLLLLAMTAQAFEPGNHKVCTPSADGQTFECRDNADTSAPEIRKQPEAPVAAAPISTSAAPAPAASVSALAAPAATSTPPPTRLPNYLLQNPSALPSSSPNVSTPVEAAATIAPANRGDATATSSGQVDAPVATTIESAPQQVPAPAAATTPTARVSEQAISAPQPKAPPASTAPVIVEKPKAEPEHAVAEQAVQPAPATPATSPNTNLPGASEFLILPASHYTLVLASVRNAAALDALILALTHQPGRLYLLKLDMPDGAWYSLCWSDFADLDGARAARSSLPVDAAITSGWPRRIGPLQKELAR